MNLKLTRFSDNGNSTLGLIFIDNAFCCFSLEDEKRSVKIMGETRIPAGHYRIKLRTEGRFHERYQKRFPHDHVGMLELQDVPGFKYILIHPGNDESDTAGCILPGDTCDNNCSGKGKLQSSTSAYLRLYRKASGALISEIDVFIDVVDEEFFVDEYKEKAL